jgi:hypothetical protein
MGHIVVLKNRSLRNNLRTLEVSGVCSEKPRIGKRFDMVGKGLNFGERWISTSPVKAVSEKDDLIVFTTESHSVYSLKIVTKGADR